MNKILDFTFHCASQKCSKEFEIETFVDWLEGELINIVYYKNTKQPVYFGVFGLPFCKDCAARLSK